MTRRLLIVDDSRLARMSVTRLVAQLRPHWTTVEAESADAATRVLATEALDGALLDLNMPGRDGLELLSELRAAAPDMPITLLSANHQDFVVNTARALGAGFFSKPLRAEDLAAFLDQIEAKAGG